jgi:hypothetical protein
MISHDVRRMQVCAICGGIGVHKPKDSTIDVDLVVAAPEESGVSAQTYAHPRCYLRQCGIDKLLSLGDGELSSVRLCDVGHKTMAAIVRRRGRK